MFRSNPKQIGGFKFYHGTSAGAWKAVQSSPNAKTYYPGTTGRRGSKSSLDYPNTITTTMKWGAGGGETLIQDSAQN